MGAVLPLDMDVTDDDNLLIGQYDGCNSSILSCDNDDQEIDVNPIPVVISDRHRTKSKSKQEYGQRNV